MRSFERVASGGLLSGQSQLRLGGRHGAAGWPSVKLTTNVIDHIVARLPSTDLQVSR
jgi:hypothetical protein